jgi:hypothetical protein
MKVREMFRGIRSRSDNRFVDREGIGGEPALLDVSAPV